LRSDGKGVAAGEDLPPSKSLTGRAPSGRTFCMPGFLAFLVGQLAHEIDIVLLCKFSASTCSLDSRFLI
jgi:hypothetical protein